MNERKERLFLRLSQLYRDPEFPGSYKGIVPFHRQLRELQKRGADRTLDGENLTRRLVQEWKHHDDKYALFKQTRHKNIPRRPYKLFNPDNIWEGDLLDMGRWTRKNGGYRYVLCLIDQFTKKLYAAPCKSKLGRDVVAAFKIIFEEQTMSRPRVLLTDNGLEFTNSLVQDYLQKVVKIRQHVTTKNAKRIKGAMIERANRTLKNILVKVADNNSGRYVDSLQAVVRGYNKTIHSATGSAPNSIDPLNIDEVRERMSKRRLSRQKQQFGSKTWDTDPAAPKLAVGDWVHVAISRHAATAFRRGYDPSFSSELYQIAAVEATTTEAAAAAAAAAAKYPNVYKLRDLQGIDLKSVYYYPELSKTEFPHKFKIVAITGQFTDKGEGDGTKYKLVKIAQYANKVWIPDKILSEDRSSEDKRTHTISSTLFMHWLNE